MLSLLFFFFFFFFNDTATTEIYTLSLHDALPIIASHSNARALCAHPRNLTDDLARMLAQRGGVIGVHMLNMFISDSNTATLDQLLDHIDHFVRLVGPEHVGLGPDCMEQWPVDVYKTLWTGPEAQSLEFHY